MFGRKRYPGLRGILREMTAENRYSDAGTEPETVSETAGTDGTLRSPEDIDRELAAEEAEALSEDRVVDPIEEGSERAEAELDEAKEFFDSFIPFRRVGTHDGTAAGGALCEEPDRDSVRDRAVGGSGRDADAREGGRNRLSACDCYDKTGGVSTAAYGEDTKKKRQVIGWAATCFWHCPHEASAGCREWYRRAMTR